MTLDEINTRRKELEGQIEVLLHYFERETHQIPTQILISQITAFGNKKNIVCGVSVITEDNEYPAFHVETDSSESNLQPGAHIAKR